MPCPEYEVLGLEKYDYGEIILEPLRSKFREVAQIVVKQIKDYLALGFDVVGIMGNESLALPAGWTRPKGRVQCWVPAGTHPKSMIWEFSLMS